MERAHSVPVRIGPVTIGGGHPIAVQSMTNTDTADVDATVSQIVELADAGSELVRITVNDEDAARAVPRIVERLRARGHATPIVGDFHYNGHVLLLRHPACAVALDKYRINPGNVGAAAEQDDHFRLIVEQAARWERPVRIGVNWGSLDKRLLAELMDANARRPSPRSVAEVIRDAMVESALRSARRAEELGLPHDRIVLSAKVSSVPELVAVYRQLARRSDYALHLGLTEAGMGIPGVVASTAGLAILLAQGIGDTIRVSLTPRPGEPRSQEVRVAQEILQALGLRRFAPSVSACPGCGRTVSTFFQELAQRVSSHIQERMPAWRSRYPGVEELRVAVMGCVVNGPGESRHAHVGISLPGSFEEPAAPVYVDGKLLATLRGDTIPERFLAVLDEYVERRFGRSDGRPAQASASERP